MRVFIFILIFISFGVCDEYKHHHEHNHVKHIAKDLNHLNLSNTQYLQAKEILQEYRDNLIAYRQQKESINEQKEKLFAQDTIDVKQFEILNTKLDTIKQQIEINLLTKFHKILSKEQREDFIEHLEDWEIE